MNFGICFLAYGDEHIEEFNKLSQQIKSINGCGEIFVCTNDKSKITTDCTIIETQESFNYNLKRIPIKHALKKYDTILFMDTDHIISSNIDFSVLSNLEEGFYPKWMNTQVDFLGKLIKINDTDYGKYLQTKTITPLQFLDECFFILKTTNGDNFIKWWNLYYDYTLELQPNNGNPGAMEGLLIQLALIKSNIKIKKSIKKFFNFFTHIGPLRINTSIKRKI